MRTPVINLSNLNVPQLHDQNTLGRRLTMRIQTSNLDYFNSHRDFIHDSVGFARIGLFVMQAEQRDYTEKIKPNTKSVRFNTKKTFNIKFYLNGQTRYINEILSFMRQFDDLLLRDIFDNVEKMNEADFEKMIQNFDALAPFVISCIDDAKLKHQQTHLEQLTTRATKLKAQLVNMESTQHQKPRTDKPRKKKFHQNKKNTQCGLLNTDRQANTIAFKSKDDLLRVKGPGMKKDPTGKYPCVFNFIRSHKKVNKRNIVETQTKLLNYVANHKLDEVITPKETKDYNFKYSFKDCPRLYSSHIDKNTLREAFLYLATLQENEIHHLIDIIV